MPQSEFDRIKDQVSIQAYAADKLERAKRGNKYVCPFCGSGGHGNANSDSAFSIKGERFKCFSCDNAGDVYDLAAAVEGIDQADAIAKLNAVARWAIIAINNADNATTSDSGDAISTTEGQNPVSRQGDFLSPEELEANREYEREYIAWARDHVHDPEALEYIAERGFDPEEMERLGVGYDPNRKRLVLPWFDSDYYHIDRDITGKAEPKYLKPSADKVGPQPIFNEEALEHCRAFYVVEGVLDALAVQSAIGMFVVALGGTGCNNLISKLQSMDNPPTAILALDRDIKGRAGEHQAAHGFEQAHLSYRHMEWPESLEGKDAAAMHANAPELFKDHVWNFFNRVWGEEANREEAEYREALKALKVVSSNDIVNRIWSLEDAIAPTETGFEALDRALGGGLPAGLVTLGAISSMGKTTLALQMADAIAEQGERVLFVTVEQSARELIAKSASRITHTMLGGNGLDATANEITNINTRAEWADAKGQRLFKALQCYAGTVSPYLDILEGVEQPSVKDIGTVARSIAAHYGQAPVIFIDYLQLLKPQSERDTDKQATDKNVMALRQLARELRTPIVVISSLNRSSYSTGVTLDSFKESGAIEYGSDVLLGLQPRNMGEDLEDMDERKAKGKARKLVRKHKGKRVRKCELVVLKNRNGAMPEDPLPFDFTPSVNYWEEVDAASSANPFDPFDN